MDLKLSHLTHLSILPAGSCLALSTWTGHGLVVSPHNGNKGAKLSVLSPTALDDEVTCAAIGQAGDVVWGMRSGQIRWTGAINSAHPFRNDFQVVGRNQAAVTSLAFLPTSLALAAEESMTLIAAGSSDGRIIVYDLNSSQEVWALSESNRILDSSSISARLNWLVPTPSAVLVGTDKGAIFRLDFQQGKIELHQEENKAIVHLEAVNDFEILYVHSEQAYITHLTLSGEEQAIQRYTSLQSEGKFITAVQSDFQSNALSQEFGQRDFLVAGYSDGSIAIWLYETVQEGKEVLPVRLLPAAESGLRVTALAISNFAVFVGGLDGSIRVFDPISGQLLKTLNERSSPRHAMRLVGMGMADERRYQVTCLKTSLNGNAVYATIGERLFFWAIMTEKTGHKGKSKLQQ